MQYTSVTVDQYNPTALHDMQGHVHAPYWDRTIQTNVVQHKAVRKATQQAVQKPQYRRQYIYVRVKQYGPTVTDHMQSHVPAPHKDRRYGRCPATRYTRQYTCQSKAQPHQALQGNCHKPIPFLRFTGIVLLKPLSCNTRRYTYVTAAVHTFNGKRVVPCSTGWSLSFPFVVPLHLT
jgi:hypothetical protein